MGIIIKLDFEKAFGKVNWDFLISCHHVRGFNERWCTWIRQILNNGTVSIKINDKMGPYFQSAKGVRQGDPLSPFLFNMAAECLTKMILKAQANKMIVGMAPDLIENGVVVLQYADDTVLCINHEPDKAINLKLLFELMSGLKVNYSKSEIFSVGSDNSIVEFYSDLFGCPVGNLPMKCLGVPVSFSCLKACDLNFLEARMIKKLDAWIGNSASSGARLTLVNSSLSVIPSYIMSMFLLNKTTLNKLDKPCCQFFWEGGGGKKKYHMIRWNIICRLKKRRLGCIGSRKAKYQSHDQMVVET